MTTATRERKSSGPLTADQCMAPGPDGTLCDAQAFHGGLHSWDSLAAQSVEAGENLEAFADAEQAQTSVQAPQADGYGDGVFEIMADVKAVRGKSTADGPALEIVLAASIDSHTAEVMRLIGKSFTRVVFRPYAIQRPLPEPTAGAPDENDAEEAAEEPVTA